MHDFSILFSRLDRASLHLAADAISFNDESASILVGILSEGDGVIFFDKNLPNAYFLDPQNIAVNAGGSWKFFNPGYNYIPFGMLRWQEEGEQALITDPKQALDVFDFEPVAKTKIPPKPL